MFWLNDTKLKVLLSLGMRFKFTHKNSSIIKNYANNIKNLLASYYTDGQKLQWGMGGTR